MHTHVHIDASMFGKDEAFNKGNNPGGSYNSLHMNTRDSRHSAQNSSYEHCTHTYLNSGCSAIATAVLVDSGQRISEVLRQFRPEEFSLPLHNRSSSLQTICLRVGIIDEIASKVDSQSQF